LFAVLRTGDGAPPELLFRSFGGSDLPRARARTHRHTAPMGNVFASCCGPSSADGPERCVCGRTTSSRAPAKYARTRRMPPTLTPPRAPPPTPPQNNNNNPRLGGGPPPTERDRAAQQRAAEQAEARQRAFESSAVGRAAMRAVRDAKGEGPGAGGKTSSAAATHSGPTAQDWLN
jgi:hypothetical protein